MARLVIFDETVRGIDLPPHPVILGRSRKADIPIHDGLLSRKHCTIIPTSGGLRLIDLKSSNGTFLNGVRIDRSELKFDDIVEIGNTVIVLLDTDTWRRGEGLTRLRNPVKAQELIQAINKRAVKAEGKVGTGVDGGAGRGKRALSSSEDEFLRWAREEWLSRPSSRQLLEDYVSGHIVSLLVRHSPEVREVVAAVVERVLDPGSFQGDAAALRALIRAAVDEVMDGRIGASSPAVSSPAVSSPPPADPPVAAEVAGDAAGAADGQGPGERDEP